MALYLIGLGIDYRLNLPLEIVERIRDAECVYWENYTSPAPYTEEDIVKVINKKITVVKRSEFEEKIESIVEKAVNSNIVILVNGDPLIATTHHYIVKLAKELGVKVNIFHNSSIFSAAIGESGLHIYKFGSSGTIVREERASNNRNNEILRYNLEKGHHTFFYLEYDHDENYIMDPYEAFLYLERYPVGRIMNKINPYVIILCGIGYKQTIKKAFRYLEWKKILRNLRKNIKEKKLPCSIIIAGKLHFTEREYIEEVLKE